MPKYSKLSIDGVVGDIYDEEAIHEDDVLGVVVNVINTPEIRTLLLNIYHPVGSYYFTDRNVNPGTFLGGTWETVEGRFLIGASGNYPVNSIGGSADAVAVEHSHTGETAVAGAHIHALTGTAASSGWHVHSGGGWNFLVYRGTRENEDVGAISGSTHIMSQIKKGTGGWSNYANIPGDGSHTHSISGSASSAGEHVHAVTVGTAGESGTGKNLPPYKAAYIWVRTA